MLRPGAPGEWDDGATWDPFVLHEDGVFKMWYGGERAGHRDFQCGYAVSTDGTHFEKAERSADGYYTLRGRSSDLIISGGFNIDPREIEEVLLEQPGVREAAVVAAPDERRGEVPVAFVVGDTEADVLEAACRRQLASFKVPRRFIHVESLPRNALGKVQRHRLVADRKAGDQ